jgi:hypothetical protein
MRVATDKCRQRRTSDSVISHGHIQNEVELHAALEYVLLVVIPVLKKGLIYGVRAVTLTAS